MMSDRLRCSDLHVAFAGRPVLASINLSLDVGLHGLWGANGTGKSTLLRVLSGATTPDRGEVWIGGKSLARDSVAARSRLAYVPDDAMLYPFMTGWDLMELCAWARKAPGVPEAILKGFGLMLHLDKRYDALSLGTRRKMLIASAFVGTADVLLMDEPANGLDAASRAYFVDLLADTARSTCVLLSTHDSEFLSALDATVIHLETLGAP